MSSLSSTSTTPTLPSPPIPPPVSNVGVSGYVTLVSFGPCRSLGLPSHTSIPLPNPPLLSNFLVDLRIRYPKAVDMLPYIKDDNTNGDAENNKNNNTEEATSEKVKGQWSVAVNEQYVYNEMQLNDGDELAIIPPISGG